MMLYLFHMLPSEEMGTLTRALASQMARLTFAFTRLERVSVLRSSCKMAEGGIQGGAKSSQDDVVGFQHGGESGEMSRRTAPITRQESLDLASVSFDKYSHAKLIPSIDWDGALVGPATGTNPLTFCICISGSDVSPSSPAVARANSGGGLYKL